MGLKPEQYWSDDRKALLIAQIVNGEISAKEACRQYGLSLNHIKEWVYVYRYSARHALDDQLTHILSREGIETADLDSAEFYGNVGDMDLTNLLQTLEMGRKDGVIALRHNGAESKIWFIGGQIVDAQSGKLRGELAVYRILAYSEGRVFARFHAIEREQTILSTTSALILEAARRKDECAALKQRLGENALRRTSRLSAMISQKKISGFEMEILHLLDGSRSTQEVIDRSRFGELETLQIISRLVKMGCLTPNRSIIYFPKELSLTNQKQTKLPLSSLIPQTIAKKANLSAYTKVNIAVSILIICIFGSISWFLASRVFYRTQKSPNGRQYQASSDITSVKNPFQPKSSATEYVVDIRTQPSDAQIILDGVKVAEGHFFLTLPRDGRPHQIQIEAEGYIPQELLFTDNAPMKEVILTRAKRETVHSSAPETSKQSYGTTRHGKHEAPVAERVSPSAQAPSASTLQLPAKDLTNKTVPKIRIIEPAKPTIQLVE